MTRAKTIRWITLTSFCLLLTAFILYRTGRLNKYLFNDPPKVLRTIDTTTNADSAIRQTVSIDGFYIDTIELMHSSKSAPIAYPIKPEFHLPDISELAAEDSMRRELMLFSGSKSGPVFGPQNQELWKLSDFIYKDSIYKKKKEQ